MSCSINHTANILDISAIRRCLFPTDDTRGGESWLQSCSISVSPTGDLIAIAHERRLVILTAKWDSNTSLTQFQITYSDSVHESDNIKAVACLPIVSQSKSSHVVPDWTCILLGFESGFLRFYTESCELLVEEQLHNEVISHIKCRSQHNPRPDLAPDLHPDEIYVQYQSTICVIPGTQIFPILRICRADLARVQAKGDTLEPLQGNLTPRKWGFTDQASISDTAVVGVNLHSQFDHLLTASTCGGFDTKYRTAAPYNNLVLAAGSRPFLGFHYALEGCPQPVFSDVAKAVATKLKSALPGWLTGSKTTNEKQMTTAMQPSETMGCRFGLCDLRRSATSLVLSPDHRLAAVSDALGRVLLVDAYRGIVLRIFKGYREAQCSFIQVPDERHSKHRIGHKIAHFLVIYSPKKGTLEIFTVAQGQKITTFSAGKHSRLIYNNYGLMGFTTMSKSRFVCQFDTLLIDNDGKIKEISVPFHFALSEKNSVRARDIHLYKKMKRIIKEGESDEELGEIYAVCVELKTSEYKLQALELLLGASRLHTELISKCVEFFSANENESDGNLKVFVENTKLLLDFFTFHDDNNSDCDNNKEVSFVEELKIEQNQLDNVRKLAELTICEESRPVEAHVGFCDIEIFSFSQFASCFTLNEANKIGINQNVDENLLFRSAEFIFERFARNSNLNEIQKAIQSVKISIRDMFFLLLHYWVHRPALPAPQLELKMNFFYNLLKMLANLADSAEIQCEYGETAPFWNYIRGILADSSRPFPALTAAILCKIICEQFSNEHVEVDMEVLSQERIAWTLLIGKLEDVSLLNIILANKPTAKFATLPKLKQEKIDISLKYILDRGKGSVSELVARWMTLCGINPENIVLSEELQRRRLEEQSEEEESDDDDDDTPPIQPILPHKIAEIEAEEVLQRLNQLKTMFPHSLEAPSLLANMCWEYVLAWLKSTTELDLLAASISCLSKITNSHIREGMCKLVWNAHLKVIFESASKLINKVGKLPKERLCRQDTSLADYQLATLLGITTDFLDVFMAAVQQSFGLDKPSLKYEQIWEPLNGPKPLVELALQQNDINYDLLHLHFQLSRVLHMMTHFTVKHSKPINNLFESYMLAMFFQDLQANGTINWNYADSRVQESRIQFLFKVISASVETVSVTNGLHHSTEHCLWMERVVEMARLWNLEVDELRRFEAIQVYANGFDVFGDELFTRVEDRKKLGVELLKVAGRRLAQFFATSPNIAQNTCAFTPAVTLYMQQLDREWCVPSDLESIENLANRSLSCLNDDSQQYEYKIADYLLDGVRTLIQLYEN